MPNARCEADPATGAVSVADGVDSRMTTFPDGAVWTDTLDLSCSGTAGAEPCRRAGPSGSPPARPVPASVAAGVGGAVDGAVVGAEFNPAAAAFHLKGANCFRSPASEAMAGRSPCAIILEAAATRSASQAEARSASSGSPAASQCGSSPCPPRTSAAALPLRVTAGVSGLSRSVTCADTADGPCSSCLAANLRGVAFRPTANHPGRASSSIVRGAQR